MERQQYDTVKSTDVQVHIRLKNGRPLCGFTKATFGNWPKGHLWIRAENGHVANCPTCQRLFAERQKGTTQ